jgi:site-specific DNA-cytosine methylase
MIGRKINPKTNKRDDYNPNIKTEQRIELRGDDKTGALTTVQKDNLVVTDKYWRALTPKECERLQTLDDDYTMFGDFDTPPNIIDDDYFIKPISKTQRYKMLGNGWCVDVVAEIFNGLRRVL